MDCKIILILHSLVCFFLCDAIRVNPCRNKIAPYSRPEPKTFGLFFGNRPQNAPIPGSGPDCITPTHPDDDPSVVSIDSDANQQNGDYFDPVNSEEQTEYQNNRPFFKPDRPPIYNDVGGFWNWWPNIITPDKWPERPPAPHKPPRPPQGGFPQVGSSSNWFWNWFGSGGQYKPPRPSKPPYYDDATKPVHEYIEGDRPPVTWKPSLLVGGPNNNIIGVTQDISNWSTVPTPRPTSPYIPGQNNNRPREQGIIGSFVGLLFKRK